LSIVSDVAASGGGASSGEAGAPRAQPVVPRQHEQLVDVVH
jgi:hypothetical protein